MIGNMDSGKNKITESAISETANYIEKHMANNKDVISVFLDIQGQEN